MSSPSQQNIFVISPPTKDQVSRVKAEWSKFTRPITRTTKNSGVIPVKMTMREFINDKIEKSL